MAKETELKVEEARRHEAEARKAAQLEAEEHVRADAERRRVEVAHAQLARELAVSHQALDALRDAQEAKQREWEKKQAVDTAREIELAAEVEHARKAAAEAEARRAAEEEEAQRKLCEEERCRKRLEQNAAAESERHQVRMKQLGRLPLLQPRQRRPRRVIATQRM